MPKPSDLDKFRDYLFDDVDTLPFTERDKTRLLRYRAIFTLKLERPSTSNKDIARMLMDQFSVKSVSRAYHDIAAADILLANVRSSEKQWIRYLVVETLKEAINLAREDGDIATMVKAADRLGKYTRLDQEDQEPIPYEDIVPAPVEYTSDPEVLGLPTPKEGAREFIERIKRRYIEAEEVEYTEVDHG